MKKILVPIDYSTTAQNALRYAILFAQERNIAIEIVYIIPPEYQPVDGPIMVTSLSKTWMKNAEKKNRNFIDKTVAQIQIAHQLRDLPSIVSRVEIGLPVSRVLELVEAESFDLMMIGTQGEHSTWDRILGSVSTGLVKNAKIPILVIPEHASYKTIKKVCVAIDLKESDTWEIHKASQFLMPGIESMDLVHISLAEKDQRKSEVNMEDLQDYYQSNSPAYKVNYFSKSSPNLSATLMEHLALENTDLLVMLGPHLSGFKSWLYQSNTKKMTYQTKVPFLRMN